MKSTLIVFVAAGALSLASCGDNGSKYGSENDTANATTSVEPASDNSAYASVPQPARTNFETRYPQATSVTWSKYEPTKEPEAWHPEWSDNMDTTDYQVTFNWDGLDYIAWYDNGEWMGSTARMTDHSKLPKAVNDAIHDRYSSYTITEVDKQNDKDRTIYEVDLEKGSDKLKLHFDENGKVVKAKGKVDGEKVKAKEDIK